MKKKWIEPQILVQEFVPNEYVAACGDKNKVYKFKCTADSGILYYYPQGDGTIDGIYTGNGGADRLGPYDPCNAEHNASATDDFYDGYVSTSSYEGKWPLGQWVEKKTPVIVWRGKYGDNGHATTNLNMSEWTTAKS